MLPILCFVQHSLACFKGQSTIFAFIEMFKLMLWIDEKNLFTFNIKPIDSRI